MHIYVAAAAASRRSSDRSLGLTLLTNQQKTDDLSTQRVQHAVNSFTSQLLQAPWHYRHRHRIQAAQAAGGPTNPTPAFIIFTPHSPIYSLLYVTGTIFYCMHALLQNVYSTTARVHLSP